MKRVSVWLTGLLLLSGGLLTPSSRAEAPAPLTLTSIAGVPSAELAGRIMSAAYARLGVQIDIVPLPANRALMMAVKGEAAGDMMRIAALDGLHPSLVQVSYPLLHGELRAITLDPGLTHWDRTQLADKRIAIRRGVVIAERATAGMTVAAITDPEQFLPMLERDRVDILVVSDIAGIDPFTDADWSRLRVLDGVVAHFSLHHYLHRRHADLAAPLAEVLAQMDASGETAAITADFLHSLGQSRPWSEIGNARLN